MMHLAMSAGQVVGIFIVTLAMYGIGKAVYNVFFHPLRKFPGPLISRATVLYRELAYVTGDLPRTIKRLHDTYGPVVRLAPNELSFISAQAWKDIYLPLSGNDGPGEFLKYDKFYLWLGPDTQVTLSMENLKDHAVLRRQIAPAFSERTLRLQEPIIQEYVDLFLRRLREISKDGTQPVDLRHWFNYLTFDVIGSLTLGSDFGCLDKSTYHPWVRAVTVHVKELGYVQALMSLGLQWFIRKVVGSPLMKGRLLHEHMTREKLEARMKEEKERPDIVASLLKLEERMTPEKLLANVGMFLIAGSETSASVLIAAVSLLADNPAAMSKVTEEVRSSFQNEDEITMTSVNGLTYLLACINETLRRFPPAVVGMPRVTPKGGAMIAGQVVAQDTVVSVPHWATYHSEMNFRDPFQFHPERFLRDERFANDSFEALQPFSVGHRNCVGRNLAHVEIRLALARLFYNFDVELSAASRGWVDRQKAFIFWDKQQFLAYLKPVR